MRKTPLACAAAAAIMLALPGLAAAQTPVLHLPPSAAVRPSITTQLSQLGDRIDRYVAEGRLSSADADHARRELNRIQDQASADRERNGGHMALADRFELHAQIDRLREEIRQERTPRPRPSPGH